MHSAQALIIINIVFFSFSSVYAQNKEAAEKLVSEGVAFHDKGDYANALDKYDRALKLDSVNLMALAEKAMTQVALNRYEEAVLTCSHVIASHPGKKGLQTVYVTYGNAYDGLKRTDRSIDVYNEGIAAFPGYYQLHYNKGITLAGVKKYDDALLCFEKAVRLNPRHASSHNAIARLNDMKGRRIQALLAYSRFLVIEPESNRAKENLESLRTIMNGNIEKTGKKSITIKVDAESLEGANADGSIRENNFSAADLLLSVSCGLDYDKKYRKETASERIIRKYETLVSGLKEMRNDNHGFYWEYYTPYFIGMLEVKQLPVLAHIALAGSNDEENNKWLKQHDKEISGFYEWSKTFEWKEQH
jgi:tetratricopeptide (TPR) repeat protein